MKVLSLLQPWASLVVMGKKQIETRSWNSTYRGPLLIHASCGKYYGKTNRIKCRDLCMDNIWFNEYITARDYDALPFGAIIGQVNLIETVKTDKILFCNSFRTKGHRWELTDEELAFGDYTEGRYGWLFSDAVKFDEPLPAKGEIILWDYDLEKKEKMERQKKLSLFDD
jgi:hypothetical protein